MFDQSPPQNPTLPLGLFLPSLFPSDVIEKKKVQRKRKKDEENAAKAFNLIILPANACVFSNDAATSMQIDLAHGRS